MHRLTPNREAHLFCRLAGGDHHAREELVLSNIGLVHHLARHYVGYGLDYEELVQEGTIGLMRAIDLFDARKGAFGSYAATWIKQAISKAIDNKGAVIRIPAHQRLALRQEARDPGRTLAGPEEAREAARRALSIASLDAPVGEDGLTVGGTVAVFDPEPEMDVEAWLADLNERQRTVLTRSLGIDGDEESLQAIGDDLGITRERARQIRDRALEKVEITLRRHGITR